MVVTDLTKFNNQGLVCTAGTDTESGVCIRPMPYLSRDFCRDRAIVPGTLLTADFAHHPDAREPHIEDRSYRQIGVDGIASTSRFRAALRAGICAGIRTGFGVTIPTGTKVISAEYRPVRSLISLSVEPQSVDLFCDNFGKVRVHFEDSSRDRWEYIPVTDLRIVEYAESQGSQDSVTAIRRIGRFIRQQEEVYLRIGLGRWYRAQDGRQGYWVQCNGLYTFPKFCHDVWTYR